MRNLWPSPTVYCPLHLHIIASSVACRCCQCCLVASMEYFSSSLLVPFFRANSQVLPVKPVFPNGEIVSVAKTNIPGKTCSEGGVGFIIAHQTVDNEQKFTVKYIPGTTAVKQETAVCMDHLSPYTLLPLARTRTPTRTTSDHTTHPSARTSPIKPKRLFCGLSLLSPSTMSPSKRNPTNSASTFSTPQTHLNQQATRRSTRIKNNSTSTENNEQTIVESAPHGGAPGEARCHSE